MKFWKYLFLFLSALIYVSCASKQVREKESIGEATQQKKTRKIKKENGQIVEQEVTSLSLQQWNAKAQVLQKKDGSTSTVNLIFFGSTEDGLRMEAFHTLGLHLASLSLVGDEMTYLVHSQKKAYSGKPQPETLQTLFRVPVDVQLITAMVFDRIPMGHDWICQKDAQARPLECTSEKSVMKVVWSERDGIKRRVSLLNPQSEVQILFKEQRSDVSKPLDFMKIKIPDNYQTIRIQI
jgi:hypothetical protein